MTEMLFRDDTYMRTASAVVTGHADDGGLVLDKTNFYPTGGGQPGDAGRITWTGGDFAIATAVKGQGSDIVLVPGEPAELPPIGAVVTQDIDWDRRYRHMRVHTALHLLSVVIPLPVTGGSVGTEKGRLDFDMPEAPAKFQPLEDALNRWISQDLPVIEDWITAAELKAKPNLVKTMSVAPPTGGGNVRLIRIGKGQDEVDVQPCGGTHVKRTGEIGKIRIGKVEKKGARNRRVNIHLDD
jgi:misacylated tRNA(Ala) deacylase